ncbi:conserved protein of unknown function [Magnetospirillum gryphiswaldense MSR-1 v2]|uniref:AFP-like domain-containing protein n=1 Tax=Magnetospirillum gryphiswaldense (strain DSM 6361 / JCM 21280 / NBRC 15271 / MSR-1) TaxID=431944 RepID=V6F598_MAGGM|nr:N-acetylneuraminate synthase [Magnetospirillum gryphiswaldense]CDL00624.1 conserved protein of unknown function [Magnetospirillum gryphiswaldense MSR-1 v2]
MACLIIAEAGVNHNGDIALAHALVDAAVAAGADVVKFQTFKADRMATQRAPKADYQNVTTDSAESQHAMLRRLELTPAMHDELIAYCRQRGIRFLSTPFDRQSLAYLAGEVGLDLIKIPSGEVTNGPLLLDAARTGRDIILSTGMSALGEVEAALQVLTFGMLEPTRTPDAARLAQAWQVTEGRVRLRQRVTLLHCTTEYPAPFDSVNLKAMETMRAAFGLRVGLSDHTVGIAIPIAGASLGAAIIEKHFTMDRTLPGPDHKASLEPLELKAMVEGIRAVEWAMGDGVKCAQEAEIKNMEIARKSLVAACAIKAGELFSAENLDVKRPGSGISPMHYWGLLGRPAKCDYDADDLIVEW